MQKLEPKTASKSMDVVSANIEQLKYLFPEVFTEGKIDFENLRGLLGEYVDDREERYSFNWNGKSQARMIAQTPSTGTLRPCPEESIDWSTTQNLFIEGDNLEVLKLLQKSYYKKVKMIYLDPPYNTGNEFIYPDKYQDNLSTYLRYTGQVDDEGFKLSTNSETSGRYHTNWLNMMYPRLKLARNMLTDDGIIFISIDDNEVANLRKVCDEIYGEENFIAQFPWRKRTAKSDVPFGVSQDYEWVIAYTKGSFIAGMKYERKYYQTDDYPNDRWRLSDLTTQKIEADRPNSAFDLVDPKTGKVYPYNPNRLWGITKDTFEDYYNRGKIVFPDDYDFLRISIPAYRVFESEDKAKALQKFGSEDAIKAASTFLPKDVGMNEDGNKEMIELFTRKIFSYPKPTKLINYLLSISNDENMVVLDFFAGSCTTAHAVLDLNKEDGGNRKFIMVQLPEPCDEKSEAFKADYKAIAEIGKERIRRVIKKIREEYPDYIGDLGFKVFKLDSTNIKPWDVDEDNLQTVLEDYISNIKDGRSEHDILYEILLKYGLDLTLPVEERNIAGKTVFAIGTGALVICLDNEISLDVIEGIVRLKDELQPEIMRVVFRDSGFKTDVVKTNAVQILKLAGIDDVKSL